MNEGGKEGKKEGRKKNKNTFLAKNKENGINSEQNKKDKINN